MNYKKKITKLEEEIDSIESAMCEDDSVSIFSFGYFLVARRLDKYKKLLNKLYAKSKNN